MKKHKITKIVLGVLIFLVSPLLAWGSINESYESAVFASLSRMIWYSGSSFAIFIAMVALFVSMLISFFLAINILSISKVKKIICIVSMSISCLILYIGAMWLMPSDGVSMTTENIWHGILSFGGILLIFITYCVYTIFIYKIDKQGCWIISCFLVFSLITSLFAFYNVYDDTSYVIASAITELYTLTMLSIIGYLTYHFALSKIDNKE